MSSVTLPSGRTVELHEPIFGEELHLVAQAREADLEELMYLKCELIAPSVSREEIAGLSRADGRALIQAVAGVWDGRPPEQNDPLGNGSASSSMVSEIPMTSTP